MMSDSVRLGRRIKPSAGFERFMWYFMRVSGLILVFLALGHLFIMHVLNNVESINYAFVASRWAAPRTGWVWRFWDWAMITLAVLHGFNGLRQILDEYVTDPRRRLAARTILWTATFFLLAIGTYAIAMFQEDRNYIEQWRKEHEGSGSKVASSR